MPMRYNVIEIFTSEEARWRGQPLADAIVGFVREARLAARCIVSRAIAGCYENGELATYRLLDASHNLPLKIEIILPAAELDVVLPTLTEMVTDGIVVVEEMEIQSHRTQKRLLPRHLRVRDVMTPQPESVSPTTPAREVLRQLLRASFNALPVVESGQVVGIITQGDLFDRLGMPLRLGLLRLLDANQVDDYLNTLEGKTARDIMTHPVVVVRDEESLAEAIRTMLHRGLKRLPVVDEGGRLVGMLSRIDIFRAAARSAPHWKRLEEAHVVVENVRTVGDITTRDRQFVTPEANLVEILSQMTASHLQRVAVVDAEGKLVGVVSDRDLLRVFAEDRQSVLTALRLRPSRTAETTTARDIMTTDVTTCTEDTPIDEALRMMTERGLKRLPVVDAEGRYAGMISREAVLRVGFGSPLTPS